MMCLYLYIYLFTWRVPGKLNDAIVGFGNVNREGDLSTPQSSPWWCLCCRGRRSDILRLFCFTTHANLLGVGQTTDRREISPPDHGVTVSLPGALTRVPVPGHAVPGDGAGHWVEKEREQQQHLDWQTTRCLIITQIRLSFGRIVQSKKTCDLSYRKKTSIEKGFYRSLLFFLSDCR